MMINDVKEELLSEGKLADQVGLPSLHKEAKFKKSFNDSMHSTNYKDDRPSEQSRRFNNIQNKTLARYFNLNQKVKDEMVHRSLRGVKRSLDRVASDSSKAIYTLSKLNTQSV